MDDAGSSGWIEARVTPRDGGADGLGRIAFTVASRDEYPTGFRRVSERRIQVPLIIGESDLSHKIAGRFFLNYPISKAE